MAGTISFGGLSTGLDSKSIIEQLVKVREGQLLNSITLRQSTLKSQKSALSPINSSFLALKSAAKTLKDSGNVAYNVKKATSSNEDTVLIGAVDSSEAINGTYAISNISQLAQPDKIIFAGKADRDVTQLGTGTVSITYKSVTTQVAITSSNNTLEGIMGAINDAEMGVTASIINDGSATPYRLVLTSDDTGADTTITQDLDTVLAPNLSVDTVSADAANQPYDAAFKVNNVTMSSHSNTVTEAIPGVTFSLLTTETTNSITLTVKQDTSAIISKITAFIKAYNDTRKTLQKAILPDDITNKFGPLGHDISLSTANQAISRVMSRNFNSLNAYQYSSLAEIGVTSDASGILVIDTAKMTSALEDNPTDVRLLFQGSEIENGIAEDLYTFTDEQTQPTGVFAKRTRYMQDEISTIDDKIEERQKTIENYRKFLQAKFNRLEQVVSQLKIQGDQLSSYQESMSRSTNRLL